MGKLPGLWRGRLRTIGANTRIFLVQGALQQYLADVIQVSAVQVEAVDSTLRVQVDYVVTRTQQRITAQFRAEV